MPTQPNETDENPASERTGQDQPQENATEQAQADAAKERESERGYQ